MERVFKHRKTGEIAYYKDGIFKSGMFWEFFPNLSGDYLQDKEFFLNFIAERENKKEYFTLISSK